MAKRKTDQDALVAIESIVSDDLVFDLEAKMANGKLRGERKIMTKKLLRIYEISHAFNRRHGCHSVHTNWRKLPELLVSHDR
jgi:hypothetical protein